MTIRLGFHGLALMGREAAEAVLPLTKWVDPAKPESAARAARTLGLMGPSANAAVPALLKCLETKDASENNTSIFTSVRRRV